MEHINHFVKKFLEAELPVVVLGAIKLAVDHCVTVTYFDGSVLGSVDEEDRLIKACGLAQYELERAGNQLIFIFEDERKYVLSLDPNINEASAEELTVLLRDENSANNARRDAELSKLMPTAKPVTNDLERQRLLNNIKKANEFVEQFEW